MRSHGYRCLYRRPRLVVFQFEVLVLKPENIRLFVKSSCGWCHEVTDWLDERGLPYESLNVSTDSAARDEMRALTGQSKAPCIEVDGHLLADFDTDQLEAFLEKLGYDLA